MTNHEMRNELIKVITAYSNRTGTPFWHNWNIIWRIAETRGLIGKPLEMAGRVMIATDLINAWENTYSKPVAV